MTLPRLYSLQLRELFSESLRNAPFMRLFQRSSNSKFVNNAARLAEFSAFFSSAQFGSPLSPALQWVLKSKAQREKPHPLER
jgi:hypothetical protein